jgi:hypothetical protein
MDDMHFKSNKPMLPDGSLSKSARNRRERHMHIAIRMHQDILDKNVNYTTIPNDVDEQMKHIYSTIT